MCRKSNSIGLFCLLGTIVATVCLLKQEDDSVVITVQQDVAKPLEFLTAGPETIGCASLPEKADM